MARLGPIFVSHGSPMLALTPTPAHRFLRDLGRNLPRPRAILCVSAHWETSQPCLGSAAAPPTIHDFGGFPDALYRLRYPAPGAPDLADEVAGLLSETGIPASLDPTRGLDHGAWVPLSLMYPQADVPVVQISLQPAKGAAWHYDVGRALATLSEDDVLVFGSGSIVHNLAALRGDGAPTEAWASAFESWIGEVVERGDPAALVDYRLRAPYAARAHPRDEHLLPLMVAAGAAGGRAGTALHRSFELGNLGMGAWGWA